MIQDPNAPLLSELRWFTGQRWRAGIIVTFGAALSAIWAGWSIRQTEILAVGVLILVHNSVFCFLFRKSSPWSESPVALRGVAWTQVIFDLACLTLLATFTNGITSPVLGLFVLHMIFASLLLQPPSHTPYIVWTAAITMMGVALKISGQWPDTPQEQLIAAGWAGTLLVTIYITTHITNNMRANYDRTRTVLAAAADAVLMIDHTGRIELANPAAFKMFQRTRAQMIGQQIDTLISLVGLPEIAVPIEKIPSEHIPPKHAIRADNSVFPIEVSVSPMTLDEHDAFTIIIRDITDRQRTEAALRELNEELTNHQERLIQHEKMVAVGRMAAGVAHEIANPLANMDGLIQLVERNPDRIKENTPNLLRKQILRITQIVRQLKDFAHPTESDRRTVAVDDLVQSAIDMIRFDQRHRNISIENNLANPCCLVHIHPQSIQQVLVNLLVNALDAAKDESEHRVVIRSECINNTTCCISITDNGTGIPDDDREHIFEPFFTTKPMGKGTGLGLTISENLVQRDGGRIKVTSEQGVGTTMAIHLPIAGCSC